MLMLVLLFGSQKEYCSVSYMQDQYWRPNRDPFSPHRDPKVWGLDPEIPGPGRRASELWAKL